VKVCACVIETIKQDIMSRKYFFIWLN